MGNPAVERNELGSTHEVMRRTAPWTLSLVACCFAAAIWAGFAPLADPDLPMHLAIGEWIDNHNSVPFVEPFAWTRAGEPYYAYSWLAQLAFFEVMRAAGPTGLHVLAGMVAMGIVLAGFCAGRSMDLDVRGSTILGALSVAIAMDSTPFLRPQLLMHALVPLAWAATFRLVRSDAGRPALAAFTLWATSAMSAGVHISFPVVAVPLALVWARPSVDRLPRLIVATTAVIVGWLTSPYALRWPAVFALNLGYNAITAGRSPAGELAPGFVVAPIVGAGLAALPFVAGLRSIRLRERVVLVSLWLVGLLIFARYFKGLGPWWWCALPLVVMALRRLPRASVARIDLAWAVLVPLAVLACSPTNIRLWRGTRAYEGGLESRMLPSLKAFAAEPAARWMETHATLPEGTRLLTTFNYGSYLKWRLPSVSESIDTRGVFPDSAALPDVPAPSGQRSVGPWRSADVAVVPVTYAVASLLDDDPAWRKIGVAPAPPFDAGAPEVGLWVKHAWLREHARSSASAMDSLRTTPALR